MRFQITWKQTLNLLLFSLPLTANGAGGDHGGGGNTINYKLVEDHVVPLTELKGYAAFRAKLLEELRKVAPYLAQRIEEEFEQSTFYVVPSEINELPAQQTGLHFRTEQGAYQVGHEVFLNSKGNASRSEAAAGRVLMHEALMMTQEKKEARAVRQVMTRLYSRPVDQTALQNALARNRFGTYLSAAQKQAVAAEARDMYLAHVKTVVSMAVEGCARDSIDLHGLRNMLSTGYSNRIPGDPAIPQAFLPATAYGNYGKGFVSPFHRDGFHGSLGTLTTLDYEVGALALGSACRRSSGKMPREVCAEAARFEGKPLPQTEAESGNRALPLQNLTSAYHNGAGGGMALALDHLSNNPGFVNVMAISMDQEKVREGIRNLEGHGERVRAILRKVEKRQRSLDLSDTRAMRSQLCKGLGTLKRDLERLVAEEKSQREAGLFEPSWEIRKRDPGKKPATEWDGDFRPGRTDKEAGSEPAI